MLIPDYIDNQNYTLAGVLSELIQSHNEHSLDIATGYFRIEACLKLEKAMAQLGRLRLLISRDPSIQAAERDQIDLVKFFRKDLQYHLEEANFNEGYKNQIDRLIQYLEKDNIQVRLYGALGEQTKFLHAKAYIFDHYSIVGSSNFTPSGLVGKTELNVINKVATITEELRHNWFDKFWEDPSVDKDYKQKLISVLQSSKFGSKPYTPYQIFIKTLYELFKDDSTVEEGSRTTLELANFQHEGFERAIKLIEKHGGCMVADAVGLGKTFIGLRVLDYYLIQLRRPKYIPRALVICPAQLRDLVWRKRLDEFGIKADIISQEELSRKTFNIAQYRYYDIVVIDESHNFRNSGTGRYRNIHQLLGTGKRDKIVLLLTATPINNSVFDLYHQISLLTRAQDNYFYAQGITNLKTFFQALVKREVESTDLLMETVVRRSRQDVIRRQEAGEIIEINGQEIKFPKRQLEQFTYNFEESFAGLYAGLAHKIDQLHLAPYNLKEFKRQQDKEDVREIKRNIALVALQKSLYLKRLESSLIAFKKSIQNQRDFQNYFAQFLEQGKLLDSNKFRKFIMGSIDDDDDALDLNNLAELLETIATKDYEIEALKQRINQDITILNSIVNILSQIETKVEADSDYDKKLVAFKQLFTEKLKGKKTLVFFYYKDTANYVYDNLLKDAKWLEAMGNPSIELITGDTSSEARIRKIQRFAPNANAEELQKQNKTVTNPINILLSTDVLSEGQNLQDAGVLVNYSLHWNPVRMIQRAGRIDRLGSEFKELMIYNCFPEEGLEDLLDLVKRLQKRIADIDREIGLDSSVLGEVIQGKSLEELIRLKQADTDEEKAAILQELEEISDLVSLDEMRLPLLEYIQNRQIQEIENIPYGINSTYQFNIPDKRFKEGGLFLAFRIHDYHHWIVYPRIKGEIITKDKVTDKRKIFNWLKCRESDFPALENMPLQAFDKNIFPVLETAINDLLNSYHRKNTSAKLKPKLSKILQSINHLLGEIITYQETSIQPHSSQSNSMQFSMKINVEIDPKTLKLIQKIIMNQNLRIHEAMIKKMWESFRKNQDVNQLIESLDTYFAKQELYQEAESLEPTKLEVVKRENIKLVAYQWFYAKG